MTGHVRRLRSQDATSTTELVLVMPVVLMMVMLVVQTGLYLHAGQVVEAAAQEALEAAQAETANAALGTAKGETFLTESGGVRNATVTVTRNTSGIRVDVQAVAPNVLPLATWEVSASVSGEIERFIPEPAR